MEKFIFFNYTAKDGWRNLFSKKYGFLKKNFLIKASNGTIFSI
jgi:hypothetical protein